VEQEEFSFCWMFQRVALAFGDSSLSKLSAERKTMRYACVDLGFAVT
jgi:hypothetical protein